MPMAPPPAPPSPPGPEVCDLCLLFFWAGALMVRGIFCFLLFVSIFSLSLPTTPPVGLWEMLPCIVSLTLFLLRVSVPLHFGGWHLLLSFGNADCPEQVEQGNENSLFWVPICLCAQWSWKLSLRVFSGSGLGERSLTGPGVAEHQPELSRSLQLLSINGRISESFKTGSS